VFLYSSSLLLVVALRCCAVVSVRDSLFAAVVVVDDGCEILRRKDCSTDRSEDRSAFSFLSSFLRILVLISSYNYSVRVSFPYTSALLQTCLSINSYSKCVLPVTTYLLNKMCSSSSNIVDNSSSSYACQKLVVHGSYTVHILVCACTHQLSNSDRVQVKHRTHVCHKAREIMTYAFLPIDQTVQVPAIAAGAIRST
jgi:hypothetical protein